MPTVTFEKDAIERFVGKRLPLEQLKERISYLGTDLEGIEDNIITVEIFPNRPDMLSLQGFARAFSSFIGHETGLKPYQSKKSGFKVIVDKSVSMRPYTACAIVKNLHFDDRRIREVMQIQEKLATTHGRNRKKSAYGIYPLQTIHFPVTYIAKDPSKVMFHPLGLERKIPASEVENVHPKGAEYRSIAKGWKKYPFFIDSRENVMCMLPYTNSNDTGKIDEKTREVFVECTGTDFTNVSVALNILVTTLADMGGEVYSLEIEYPEKTVTTPDFSAKEMKMDVKYINSLLGFSLSEKDAAALLAKMGFGYKAGKALIPCYRSDILHQVDLAEDIAIAYGYENFEEIIPKVATVAQESKREVIRNKASDLLVGLGFLEASTYALSNNEHQSSFMGQKMAPIELANAISLDYSVLRAWLLPSLMEVIRSNAHHEYPQKIFTSGIAFRRDQKEETGVGEDLKLALVSCHENAGYTEARQIVEYVLRSFGISTFSVRENDVGCFITGRSSQILLDGKALAILGEIHPQVLTNWGITMPCCAAELNLDALFVHLGIGKEE